MIRVINGKRYNSNTATKVAGYWNGLGIEDYKYESRSLYLTKQKNWFLIFYGSTGIEDDDYYDEKYPDDDSGLRPMTDDEAFQWLESHEKTVSLEKYFADRIEDA